ncbi:hypothetical protein CFRS1_v009597 [Colletotrichum fructicola]|nr:hypothetical protein CFRS1_v009597 [Colletotrichum fructicola]
MLAPKPSTAVTNGLLQCWESMSSQVTDGPGAASSEPLLAPKASTPSEQRSVIGSEPVHHGPAGGPDTENHPPPPYNLPEARDITMPNGQPQTPASSAISQSEGGSFRSRIREIGREIRAETTSHDSTAATLCSLNGQLENVLQQARSLRYNRNLGAHHLDGQDCCEKANVLPGPVYKTQFDPRNDIPWPSTLIPRPADDQTKTPWLGSYDPNESVYHNICNIRSLCHRNEQRLIGIETQLSEMKRLLLRPRPTWYPFNPPTPAPMEL